MLRSAESGQGWKSIREAVRSALCCHIVRERQEPKSSVFAWLLPPLNTDINTIAGPGKQLTGLEKGR